MSRKPTQETLAVREQMEAYINQLEDSATFILPDMVDYISRQPGTDTYTGAAKAHLRTTISNSMKQYEGRLFVDTGEKASTGKRGRKPVVWRKTSQQNTEEDQKKGEPFVEQETKESVHTSEKEPESSSIDFNFE